MDIHPPTMLQGLREVWQRRDPYRCPAEAGHVSSCSGPAVVIARGRGSPLLLPAVGGGVEVARAALTVQVKVGASCSWNLEMYSRYHPGHWGSWAFFWLNSEGPGLGSGEPGTFLR